MPNDPILDAIKGGGTGVADDPILNAIKRGQLPTNSKIGTPDVVGNYAKQNGVSIGEARRQLRGQGFELMSTEEAQARAASPGTSASSADDDSDPILSAIKTQGPRLHTPTLDELATGTSRGAQMPSPSERAASVGGPMIHLGLPRNFAVDATQVPRSPFTNQFETQPPIATDEEIKRNGTIGPQPGFIDPGLAGAAILPGLNPHPTLQGNEPIINPERGLIAPQDALTGTQQRQHPILTGLGQLTEGLTTPANLLLLAGTAGFGELPAAMKVGLSTYFTAQMANGAKDYSTQGWQAYKRGDTAEAKRLWTLALGSGAMGAVTGAHGIREMGIAPEAGPEPVVPKGTISEPLARDEASTALPRMRTIGAGEKLAPETSATLAAQTDALAAGTNKVVYFPKGQSNLPEPPENAAVTIVPGEKPGAGTYYHTDEFTPQQIRSAVKDGSYAQLLGYTQSKEQAAAAGKPAGVVARDASGTEIKAGLVDSTDAQAIAKQAAEFARQFPDAKISVESPEHVIRSRQAPTLNSDTTAAQSGASTQTPASDIKPRITEQETRALGPFMEQHQQRMQELQATIDDQNVAPEVKVNAERQMRESLQGRRKANIGAPEGQAERRTPRTYEDVQREIDQAEAAREAEGIHYKAPEFETPKIKSLYAERDAIGGKQLAQSQESARRILAGEGLNDTEIRRVMEKYSLDGDPNDAMSQYRARQYSQQSASRPLQKQIDEVATGLAVDRGEHIDEVRDVSEDTMRTSRSVVEKMQGFLLHGENSEADVRQLRANVNSIQSRVAVGEGIPLNEITQLHSLAHRVESTRQGPAEASDKILEAIRRTGDDEKNLNFRQNQDIPKPSDFGRRQAQFYANLQRNPVEKEFAQSYLKSRLLGKAEPKPIQTLDPRRAVALKREIDSRLATKQPQVLSERFSPGTIAEAKAELGAAHEMASTFERPGRYHSEVSTNAKENDRAWYGVGSSRHIVAEQFPWYDKIKQGAEGIGELIKKGKGAEYERLLGEIAEHIEREKESAAPVVAEFAPRLRELSDKIDGNDVDLSESLAQLANADGRGFKNLREYIQGKVQDAERANSFFAAIDDAAQEARQAGAEETAEDGGELRARESGRAAGSETAQDTSSEEDFLSPSNAQTAEAPEVSEAHRLTAEQTRRPHPSEEQNILPGMDRDLDEQRAGAARVLSEHLSEEADRSLGSIEAAAGEMERNSPLFRGKGPQGELYSGVHPGRLVEGARVLQRAWEEKIAQPFIDRVLKIGDKYRQARLADPAVAEGLHLLDNAPTYLRAKAAQVVKDVIGGLSRPQERLFTLLADADSRENLRMNHPEEYAQAQDDPAIQTALRKYRPLERELTTLRERMGGQTLEQDYLRRVYDKYVAGVDKAEAPGTSERGTSAFDRVIRPQRTDKLSREATAEYHYESGLHEFGPAFATKFIGTHLKALRDQVARESLDKATALPTGEPEPRTIDYNGQRYYRPDVARELRDAGAKDVKSYDRYDPTAGEKFPVPVDGKYLGPRELVKTLTDFGRREENEPGALRRFFQEQILGFGFGVPHIANIMRRVSQTVAGGAVNPEGWARAWKVVLSKELRSRGIAGLADPTFDMLAKHGAISTGEVSNLKAYVGGNVNPANWARGLAQVGHKFLFEPTAAKGFGGLDQRARLYIADLVQSQRPDLSDAKIAETVRNALGDYNRANWTDQQKMLSKFMMFPGWDFSSVRWVLQHPIKTTVPPALMVLLANRTLNYFGQNRDEDQNDISNIHVGDRSYGTSLLRESAARNLFRPAIAFAQSKVRGESNQRALDAASRGLTAGAGGLLSMLRPDLSGFLALATNRQGLFTGKEIVGPRDYDTPGKILPSLALEKQAVFTVRHAVPALDRMLDSGEDLDLKSFAGGNLGVPNYRDGAEQRLIRNAAEASRVFSNVSRLAKTDPRAAMDMLKDPDSAAFALFHHDLGQMTTALRKIDQVRAAVDAGKMPDDEKQSRLKAIDNARQMFVNHADALNNLLFKRRSAARDAASSNGASRNTIPLMPSFQPSDQTGAPQ